MAKEKRQKPEKTKAPKPKYNMWQNSRFMIKLAWTSKEKKVIVLSLLSAALAVALNLVNLYVSPTILSAVERRVSAGELFLTIAGFVLGLMLVSAVSAYVNTNTLFGRVSVRAEIMNLLNRKAATTSYPNVDDDKFIKLLAKSSECTSSSIEATEAIWATLTMLTTNVSSVFTLVGGIALTVSLFVSRVPESAGVYTVLNNPLFVVLMIGVMLTITYIAPILSNKADSYWALSVKYLNRANRVYAFFGCLGYHREIATDVRMYRQERICENNNRVNKENTFGSKGLMAKYGRGPMGLYNAASSAVSVIFTGVVYAFVCLKAWAGAFGLGAVAQYVASITKVSGGMSGLISALGDMRNNAAFLVPIFEFFDIPNNMYQGSLSVEKRRDRKYDVEFRNVSFKYPGSENYALRNVSMKLEIGRRMAVVGMNGSGKTTFIKLLCRLYDPTEGEILLSGINIRKYNYAEYMMIFSVVFQDFQLFASKLGENVASGTSYDCGRVTDSLKKAGFAERLSELQDGVETYLYKDYDKNGVNISGGEAQKIAIARALYKDAPFIILDEPTAALDPIAEADIYSKFNDIAGDRTAIYISHRLSSCKFCDMIAVFHEGAIIQQGTHDTLVADKNGKYYELWHAQAQYYTE